MVREEEEYAIVSKNEFLQLKKELEKLKKDPLQGSEKGENLKDSIDGLNISLTSMMNLFKEAADDMTLEERDKNVIGKKLDPLGEKLDTLIEQNQKIAKGLVAVADMVREKLDEMEQKEDARAVKVEEHKEPEMPPGPMPPRPMGGMGMPGPAGPGRMPDLGPMPEPMGSPMGMPGPQGLPPRAPPAGPPGKPKKAGILGGLMK